MEALRSFAFHGIWLATNTCMQPHVSLTMQEPERQDDFLGLLRQGLLSLDPVVSRKLLTALTQGSEHSDGTAGDPVQVVDLAIQIALSQQSGTAREVEQSGAQYVLGLLKTRSVRFMCVHWGFEELLQLSDKLLVAAVVQRLGKVRTSRFRSFYVSLALAGLVLLTKFSKR